MKRARGTAALLLLALALSALPLIAAALPALQEDAEPALVLYDATEGTTPDEQGFTFFTLPLFGAAASQTYTGGVTALDSTPVQSEQAGYFGANVPPLSRAAGYSVRFTVRLLEESHANSNRAGFSVITLGEDARGIELGFWADEIWAQEGGGGQIFTHAEGAAFDTTALVEYELRVEGERYTLRADETEILTGSVRDYTSFEGPVDPYETPNLLFLGDDTSSAAAKVELAYVALLGEGVVTPTPTATASPTATATAEATARPTSTATPTVVPTVAATSTPVVTSTPEAQRFLWLPCIRR